jgi:hypothetical protein
MQHLGGAGNGTVRGNRPEVTQVFEIQTGHYGL